MKIHELIEKPENWTTGATARTKDGQPTNSQAPDATCWCLIGAADKCYSDRILPEIYRVLDAETNFAIGDFNDSRTHAEVLALVKSLDV